jgi:molybdopterin-guanine dinucleotide biosynthesis protein
VILVVGGSSSKVGKTTVICEIIAATRDARWTAVKITPHQHEPKQHGDTERYAAAGAVRTVLSSGPAPREGNVIIESNSVLDELTPDLFVFVEGGPDSKPSARRHAGKADFHVAGHAPPELITEVRRRLDQR